MSVWKCPVCGSFMQHRGKSWSCAQGHNFDMAKSGYVNLLPVNRKHAKNPGDNAVMMRARKNFLDAGHYALLLQALEQAAVRYGRAGGVLLDAGCGEGYYTEGVSKALAQADLPNGNLRRGYFQECGRCGGETLPECPFRGGERVSLAGGRPVL